MLSVVKMPLKGEIGGHALNSHGTYIVDHGKSWKNHGIVFLNFCGAFAIKSMSTGEAAIKNSLQSEDLKGVCICSINCHISDVKTLDMHFNC